MTAAHPFDIALRLDRLADDMMRGRTQPEWTSMVSPFGGITAAVLVRAIEMHPDRIGEALALTVNFAAPIADGDFEISLRAARSNRTNQHWVLELSQAGEVKTTATAVFGVRRETWSHSEASPPRVPPPDHVPTSSGPGDFVRWGRLYDMRFTDGPFPDPHAQPCPVSMTTVWTRDVAKRPVDYPALAALCDIFYPRVFLRLGGFHPAGTISLTTYFHADGNEIGAVGSDFVLGTAHANRFAAGYFDQSAQLWTHDGILLATSHQVVYFKGSL